MTVSLMHRASDAGTFAAPAPRPRTHAHVEARPSRAPWFQWRGPHEFVWRHERLPMGDLPTELDGLRVLHLSDFHTRHYWPPVYDKLLARIASDPPDLILFTGDFVESRRDHMPAVPHVKRLIEGFSARLGCYGTLGNHDLYHFAPQLARTNVELLEGARKLIPLSNANIELIGFPGVARRDLTNEFLRSLPPRGERTLRIVMSHYPEHLPRAAHLRPHLFLAGHTHGGQVCLPRRMPIITHSKLPRRLCHGVHRMGETWHVVSRGLGFSGLPLRVLCPSEVMELTLAHDA
jgi:uncharacterized protein